MSEKKPTTAREFVRRLSEEELEIMLETARAGLSQAAIRGEVADSVYFGYQAVQNFRAKVNGFLSFRQLSGNEPGE